MKINAFIILLVLVSVNLSAQVGINTDSSNPDGSAMLDVKSTSKGVLVPRLSKSQRNSIASPATGLIVYQTDDTPGFYYYSGTSWVIIGSEAIAINDLADGIATGHSVFLGTGSGTNDDGTDNRNTALGDSTLYSVFEGTDNTAVGYRALKNTVYYSNSAFGSRALESNYQGDDNTAFGAMALNKNTNGYKNTAVGRSALENNLGMANNTAVGAWALNSSQTGMNNTAVGESAAQGNTSGSSNTSIGQGANTWNQSGSFNTMIGCGAGAGSYGTSKSGNVFLGYNAGNTESGSNLLYIENSNSTSPLIWGDFSNNRVVVNGNASHNANNRTFFTNGSAGGTTSWFNDSDRRLKKNISSIDSPLDKVLNLRGVTFEWEETDCHPAGLQMGFIAQEAETVIPEVVDITGERYSMQYAPITALLVEAIKEQQRMIETLQGEVEQLKNGKGESRTP